MALEHLEGTTYGPISVEVSAAKVAEYVAATGDDDTRWAESAPPGYAGALLFAIAPAFLHSEEVAAHTAVLIHADQTFTWLAPLAIGAGVDVTGRIDRVRGRGGIDFVSFGATVTDVDGEVVLESASTFLLGAEPAGDQPDPRTEPSVREGTQFDRVGEFAEGRWGPVVRSASRLDLVRYAAASGDFNPIHFDHDAAVLAGLPAVVVHGLLMGAWLLQPAATIRSSDSPLDRAKLRFRDPLFPAQAAVLDGTVRDSGDDVDMGLTRQSDGGALVTANIRLAQE